MKKFYFILLSVILLLSIHSNAQVNPYLLQKPLPKPNTTIPFGKRFSYPDVTIYSYNYLSDSVRPGINIPSMPGINHFDKNTFRKRLDYFRQMLLTKQNSQILYVQQNKVIVNRHSKSNSNSDFHLTKDINTLAESYPYNSKYSGDNLSFAILQNVIYFAADDGIHGSELWRSDGSAAGTYMIMDIEPGTASSSLHNITAVNNKIYFSATIDNYGIEPWVSDGTVSGTHLLKDVLPGIASSYPDEFTDLNGKTYFVTQDENYSESELWKTDGTTEGTKLVINTANKGSNYIYQLTESQNLLFFQGYDIKNNYAPQLWRSDGTKKGTYSLRNDITLTDVPLQFTNYNNKLYFSSNDGSGRKLWVSDGTDAGTIPAPGNNNVLLDFDPDYYDIKPFVILNDALYMPGGSKSSGNKLYKYDANDTNGITKIKSFISDSGFVMHSEMQVLNNTLFFKVSTAKGGMHDELWSTNGNNASTKLINKFQAGETINNLYSTENHLFFVKYDKLYGGELWVLSESFPGQTSILVKDIFSGLVSSNPSYLTAFKGRLFFSATNNKKGNELFMTSDIDTDAIIVKDINTITTSGSGAGSGGGYSYENMIALKNSVVFPAYQNASGNELYKSDGTEQGTYLLNNIMPGELSSNPYNFQLNNNSSYFIANSTDTTYAIYKTEGTKSSLQKITPDYYYLQDFKIANNGVVFYVIFSYYTYKYELWRSDGTSAGTFMLSSSVYHYNYLNVAGNTAFFAASDAHGLELWKSDGSISGTKMVKDIAQGGLSSFPVGLFVYNNEVYFGASAGLGSTANGFWKSDGTEAGTVELKNIYPFYGSNSFSTSYYFCISNDILYFVAYSVTNDNGFGLWKTDGTKQGTQLVKYTDKNGDAFQAPYNLTDVNDTLFFIGDDGLHGTELWKSDGTKQGTRLVKDITPGIDGSNLDNLISYKGKLYFTNNGVVWSSDGTNNGTMLVDDAIINSITALDIIANGNKLFICGNDYKYGTELYEGEINDEGKFVASSVANSSTKTIANDILLYPNPAKDVLNISTGSINLSKATIQVTNIAGSVLINKKIDAFNKQNVLQLNISQLATGTYFVKLLSANGSEKAINKFIKE